ncbi:MAG: hypothetical protein ABIR80_01710 [Opitutaceae bacterium]
MGQRLRADVAETVATETDIDTELRHLIAALGAARLRAEWLSKQRIHKPTARARLRNPS